MSTICARLALSLIAGLGFLPFILFLSGDDRFTMLDSVAVSVGVGVVWAYAPGWWHWLKAHRTTAGHLLVLGVGLTWVALVGRLGWLWAWRLLGRPDQFFDHWFVALLLYFVIVGGALHLVANRAIDDQIPVAGWITLGVAVAIGVITGTGLILYS